MKAFFKELFVIGLCLILGYFISQFILTTIRGTDYNSNKLEENQNETSVSK